MWVKRKLLSERQLPAEKSACSRTHWILSSRAGQKRGTFLGVARIAAIMGAKKTPDLIPLAHPLPLTSVKVEFFPDKERSLIEIEATVKVSARTGVEMEALTAVACAGLTIYDMCKAVDRGMVVSEIRLMEKSGGRSGHFKRSADEML